MSNKQNAQCHFVLAFNVLSLNNTIRPEIARTRRVSFRIKTLHAKHFTLTIHHTKSPSRKRDENQSPAPFPSSTMRTLIEILEDMQPGYKEEIRRRAETVTLPARSQLAFDESTATPFAPEQPLSGRLPGLFAKSKDFQAAVQEDIATAAENAAPPRPQQLSRTQQLSREWIQRNMHVWEVMKASSFANWARERERIEFMFKWGAVVAKAAEGGWMGDDFRDGNARLYSANREYWAHTGIESATTCCTDPEFDPFGPDSVLYAYRNNLLYRMKQTVNEAKLYLIETGHVGLGPGDWST